MTSLSSKLKRGISFASISFKSLCTSSITLPQIEVPLQPAQRNSNGRRVKASDVILKENWLTSLSCPCPENTQILKNEGSEWVIGVDPDVSGAVALLKSDDSGCFAQVFDSPHVQILVGKRTRKRLDANSIVQLVRHIDAPIGILGFSPSSPLKCTKHVLDTGRTPAYIEQSIPFPRDGKQGWWGGGFGYGLWIGILVASGFSVVPVPSFTWNKRFKLSGCKAKKKDDSRRVASMLFPSLSSLLERKKDHGRAEALLIAAYGKGQKNMLESSSNSILQKMEA